MLCSETQPQKAPRILSRKRTKNGGMDIAHNLNIISTYYVVWRFLAKMWMCRDTLEAALLRSRNTEEIHLGNDLISHSPLKTLLILSRFVSMALSSGKHSKSAGLSHGT